MRRPTLARPATALFALALGGCGDVPTDPWTGYDVAGLWSGYFLDDLVGFPVVLDLTTREDSVMGGATVDATPYAVAGRVNYPVVYLRLTSPGDTLTFLGETVGPRRLRGTLLLERHPPLDAEISFDRR